MLHILPVPFLTDLYPELRGTEKTSRTYLPFDMLDNRFDCRRKQSVQDTMHPLSGAISSPLLRMGITSSPVRLGEAFDTRWPKVIGPRHLLLRPSHQLVGRHRRRRGALSPLPLKLRLKETAPCEGSFYYEGLYRHDFVQEVSIVLLS